MLTQTRPLPQALLRCLRGQRLPLARSVAMAALLTGGIPAVALAQAVDPLGQREGENAPPPVVANPADAAGDQIAFEADTLEYETESEKVTATGNVVLARDGQSVRADAVTWNRETGEIVATGNVRAVDQDGNLLLTERVELTDELKAGALENLLLVLREGGRIAADRGERNADGSVTLDRAAYTACSVENVEGCPKKPSWRITAVRVLYNPTEDRVRYEGARLEILGLSLPLPYLAHSTSGRAGSGFVVPSLQLSETNGVEIANSYYWRLAENRDLTVTGHLFSKVLPMVSAQYRELTDLGAYQITGYATRSSVIPITGTSPVGETQFRGYIEGNGRFQFTPEWSLTASTRLASDRTFLRRYDISNDDRLRSTANLERITPDSYFSLAGWVTQTLGIGENQGLEPIALPVLDYRRRLTDPVLGGRLQFQANTLGIIRSDGQDTQRAFAGAQWDLRRITGMGQEVTLTGLVRGDVYHSDESTLGPVAFYRGNPGWQTRGVATAAVDVRWPFVGEALGGTQVFAPRVQLVASPQIRNLAIPNEDARAIDLEDSNLFALNRFPGYDRVEDGVRLTYGFDWQLDRPGWRVMSTIGQSYRLTTEPSLFPEGTGLSNRTSDVVGRTRVQYRDLISVTHRFRLDKDSLAVRRNEIDAAIGSARTYLEVGYLRLNRDIAALEDLQDREELRLAGRVTFKRYWSLFGSAVVNLTDRNEDLSFQSDGFEPLRTRLGLAYADECLEVNLTWRRDYQTTGDASKGNTFQVRFALKNLGL